MILQSFWVNNDMDFRKSKQRQIQNDSVKICRRQESHFRPCQPADRANPRPAVCMSAGLAARPRLRGAGSFRVGGSRPRSVATAGMPPFKVLCMVAWRGQGPRSSSPIRANPRPALAYCTRLVHGGRGAGRFVIRRRARRAGGWGASPRQRSVRRRGGGQPARQHDYCRCPGLVGRAARIYVCQPTFYSSSALISSCRRISTAALSY